MEPKSSDEEQASPPSSDFTIVFLYKLTDRKYNKEVYSPIMTGGRASHEEINQVLSELEALLNKIPSDLTILSLLLFFLFVPAILVIIYFSFSDYVNITTYGFYFLFGWLLYMSLISIILSKWKKSKIEYVKKQTNICIKTHQEHFMTKGLRWNIPHSFPAWVDLNKDYNNYQPPNYVPSNEIHIRTESFGSNQIFIKEN